MITVTSVEAQNRFGQLLDTVQREPVTMTRHGRTAAFIVSEGAGYITGQNIRVDGGITRSV